MLFLDALLDLLVTLSFSLQVSSVDLSLVMAKLKMFDSVVTRLKEDDSETSTEHTCSWNLFSKVKVNGVSTTVQQAFKTINQHWLIKRWCAS